MKLDGLIAAVREQQVNSMVKWRLDAAPRVHLAILREPYLHWILTKKKTIESRFSKNNVLPYGYVEEGDAIILKRSSGPVVAFCFVDSVVSSHDPLLSTGEHSPWERFRVFDNEICADDAFWEARREARYATLAWVEGLRTLYPIEVEKAPGDRRPWIILRGKQTQIGAKP